MATVRIALRKNFEPAGFMKRQCWPTRSKHFVITRQVIPGKDRWPQYKLKFAITHTKTGFSALKNFRSVRRAQLVAAILDRLPMKWGNITRKNAIKRKEKLDPKILKWFGEFDAD